MRDRQLPEKGSAFKRSFSAVARCVGLSLQPALASLLFLCTVLYVVYSWDWPLVGDAPLIHYVVFLTHHCFKPYRQIIDFNQPGTLAMEAAVMSLLGTGARAWRVFDLSILFMIGLAMDRLCRPYSRFAALFAGVVFAFIHGRDGLIQLGQRDLVLATLLAWAYALLFGVLRSREERFAHSLGVGLLLASACTIKPVAMVLPPVLLWWYARQLKSVERCAGRHLVYALSGFALPFIASLIFLLRQHVLLPFIDLTLHLAPYHASLWRLPPGRLLSQIISSVTLPLVVCWLPIFVAHRRWRRPLDQALILGFVFGAISFYVQGRGYPYHRYPSEVFLLLLVSLAFTDAWKADAVRSAPYQALKMIAAAGLIVGGAVIVPRSLMQVRRFEGVRDPLGHALQSDLNTLGGAKLSGQIQCFDMAGGCIATLYHMRLVQSTGFLYDCCLYPADEGSSTDMAERDRYRQAFLQALLSSSPKFLVVTSDECGPADYEYRKLARWPWLQHYLADGYELSYERRPEGLLQWEGKPTHSYGYRIYKQKLEHEIP